LKSVLLTLVITLVGGSAFAEECDPNYDPCVPVASDVDCAGGKGNGPAYVYGPVTVIGQDVYGLDRDHDGIGCE
jgi:hypothetical protein